ncbi:ATP-binding protein [Streptomyces nitrosporeus]|uniref:ATP-binding protein n=1 Tax=Streptomyces nitrosporeus TaxID=28894 RepID=UPI0039A2D002
MTVDGDHPVDGPGGAAGGGPPGPSAVPRVPRNAAAARAVVAGLLDARSKEPGAAHLADTTLADALLVTSELVTNAFRHGGGLTGFTAEVSAEGLLLTVSDASREVPSVTVHGPGSDLVGGYGWPLVHRLSSRLTVTPYPGGKRIAVLIVL